MKENPNIPKHIAIIPDGNRRWAKNKGLKPWMGHWHGLRALQRIMEWAVGNNIKCASFWGASIDNVLKRDKKEVDFLMKIFKNEFKKLSKSKFVRENKIKINAIGEWQTYFPKETADSIKECIESTKNNDGIIINFFLAYSGTKEIIDCAQRISDKNIKKITEETIKQNLLSKDLPPVDLLIRTGGEPHNSDGFMMWDTANAQYVFLKKFWPDFTCNDFQKAIKEYYRRERRLGS